MAAQPIFYENALRRDTTRLLVRTWRRRHVEFWTRDHWILAATTRRLRTSDAISAGHELPDHRLGRGRLWPEKEAPDSNRSPTDRRGDGGTSKTIRLRRLGKDTALHGRL